MQDFIKSGEVRLSLNSLWHIKLVGNENALEVGRGGEVEESP